jgi:serine/threonine protein kinase
LRIDGLETQCGTKPYVAPEIFRGEKYSSEIDLWSLGIFLFVILTGCFPFKVRRAVAVVIAFERVRGAGVG